MTFIGFPPVDRRAGARLSKTPGVTSAPAGGRPFLTRARAPERAAVPDGAVLRTRRTPRASSGPDLRQLFLGCEGILGIVTEVSFSLRPQPEARRGQAFHFLLFDTGGFIDHEAVHLAAFFQ